jgi:hypothetical protein
MSLREELATRYGPLPGWAWLLGVCGGAFVMTAAGMTAVALAWPKPVPVETAGPPPAPVPARSVDPEPTPPKNPTTPPLFATKEPELPVTSMDAIAAAYRADANAADVRFRGKRVRTEIVVRKSGAGWIGTVATLRNTAPRAVSLQQAQREAQEAALRGFVPNVVFQVPDERVADGARVVVEATCSGLAPDTATGVKLTFTDGRVVR